jgi:hypothetical protein
MLRGKVKKEYRSQKTGVRIKNILHSGFYLPVRNHAIAGRQI